MSERPERTALLELFVGEATAYLAAAPGGIADARASLEQVVRLLEGEAHGAEIATAVAALAQPGERPRTALAALAARIGRRLRPPRAPSADAEVPEHSFETSEYDALRALFRDEASDGLEAIAGRLLAAGAELGRGDLDEVLRRAHSLKGAAGTVGLGAFADAMHQLEGALEAVRRAERRWGPALRDSLVEVVDGLRAQLDAGPLADPAGSRRLDDALRAAARDDAAPPDPRDVTATAIPAPSTSQLTGRVEPSFLRVEPARVDRLMDAVGELVFDRTRIERRALELAGLVAELERLRTADDLERELPGRLAQAGRAVAELRDHIEQLRRTTATLQDGLTSVRMESARGLYQRLAPQLRAIARAAGKRVELVTIGGETEFDKAVADEIVDPMIHLLRNAVAHGIEAPAERRAAGKPADGRVVVSAHQEAGAVVLEISDDGAGIDPAALAGRLVAAGRWSAGQAAAASERDILRALFDARLSSREHADELAGRGIGLDAVREVIARLGGEIEVRSTRGIGTTFTMRLPLTTAVSNALLFKVGGQVYAVPNVHVLETSQIEASSPALPSMLRLGDEPVPLVALHEVLGAPLPRDARTVAAVVIEYVGRRLAMTCDKIVGPREIVVKSLGPLLGRLSLFAGGTISGSGKVQLILDPSALIRIAYPELPPIPSTPRRPADAVRVLVADDSAAVRAALRRALEPAGYAVDEVDDGAAAWDALRARRYDALVTDLDMPQVGGFELIERLRAHGPLAELPVVIVTSRATPAAEARAATLAVRTLLPKPVNPERLLAALSGR